MKKLKLLFLFLIILLIYYGVKLEPFSMKTKVYELGEGTEEKIRIIQVSDIQVSKYYPVENLELLVDQVNQLNPDIFIFTGDLFENYSDYGPKQEVADLLSQIKTKYGSYAVWGNRDYGGGCQRIYPGIMEETQIILLKDTGITLKTQKGKMIYLAGLDDSLLGSPDGEKIKEQVRGTFDYRILLSHEPDVSEAYLDDGFDLILSGHSHGGQVLLPFGGIKTALAKTYTKGFYSFGTGRKTLLYVNTGIGTSHIPVRLGVPPQIAVFDVGL